MLMDRILAFLAAALSAALLILCVQLSLAAGAPHGAAVIAQASPKSPKHAPKASQPKASKPVAAHSACGGDRINRCHRCARFMYDEAQPGMDGVCQFCKSCGGDCGDKDC